MIANLHLMITEKDLDVPHHCIQMSLFSTEFFKMHDNCMQQGL